MVDVDANGVYPCTDSLALCVAATDRDGNLAAFSNFGPSVDIAAPGVDLVSTVPAGYGVLSGTSAATPLVAAAAAVIVPALCVHRRNNVLPGKDGPGGR